MKAALDQVRAELGEEALIVRTRQIEKPRMPWQKKEIETVITAAIDSSVLPLNQRPASRLPNRFDESDFAPLQDEQVQSHQLQREPAPAVPSQSFTAAPTDHQLAEQLETDLKARVDQLQSMVDQLSRQSVPGTSQSESPVEFQPIAQQLELASVDPALQSQLLSQLQTLVEPSQYGETALVQSRLQGLVEQQIKTGGTIHLQKGRPQVTALIGPTGVGKTTTIAKLAANFRLKDGLKIGLITIDTYRIAAVDQLQSYAEILSVPMQVVTSASQLQQAILEMHDRDLILIDTAGRSPLEQAQIEELETLFAGCPIDQRHLVLSLTTDYRQLNTIVEKFRALKPTACLVTKLDEAPALGGLLSISHASKLPISYLTMGQNVPDDIEAAYREQCAARILQQNPTH